MVTCRTHVDNIKNVLHSRLLMTFWSLIWCVAYPKINCFVWKIKHNKRASWNTLDIVEFTQRVYIAKILQIIDGTETNITNVNNKLLWSLLGAACEWAATWLGVLQIERVNSQRIHQLLTITNPARSPSPYQCADDINSRRRRKTSRTYSEHTTYTLHVAVSVKVFVIQVLH